MMIMYSCLLFNVNLLTIYLQQDPSLQQLASFLQHVISLLSLDMSFLQATPSVQQLAPGLQQLAVSAVVVLATLSYWQHSSNLLYASALATLCSVS